ncbi:MAG TPA: pyruvate kinase [Blastocatellia bacterium]|nr:pyruvate kinase [Blastocatellia bacterium]
MRRAKIVATIGPASESEEKLRALMLAGLDVARINMSHGEREHHGEVIDRIRRLAADLKRPVAVMMDLSGPKIRTGKIRGGEATLEEGEEVRITTEEIEGDAKRFSANYPLLAREVHAGDRLLISDGEIELQVTDTTPTDVVARVIHGGVLGSHKGINLPGAHISIPSITEKDVADLKFGISRDIDIVAQSFVRSAADCRLARGLISDLGGDAKLIAKIEKPEAIDDLENIIDTADGVMVARGDLAVETSTELVPVLQKRIIAAALRAEKRVITATQMLQSMIENPRPTRAEASDVSNAILDGSDAVMLSGETAVGRFPVESVLMMERIIRSTEEMTTPATTVMRESLFGRRSGSYGRAIAEAAVFAAEEIGCRLIVVISRSGHMAKRIASLRPGQRIVALTMVEKSYRQMALIWGIEPYLFDGGEPERGTCFEQADRALLDYGLAERGESIVVMAGRLEDIALSHSMKLHRVGDLVPAS